MGERKKILIPCSGIGKAVGEVTREAARLLMEELRPGEFETVCLPLMMIDEEEIKDRFANADVYAINGCPEKCASVSVKHVGAEIAKELLVVRVLAKNRTHKPKSIIDLGDGGRQLALDVANAILEEEQ